MVYRIPYQNLVMMNADKLKESYRGKDKEPEVEKMSGKEMMKQKKGG